MKNIQIFQAIHVEASSHVSSIGSPSTDYDAVLGAVISSNVLEEVDQMEIRSATPQEKREMGGSDVVLVIKPVRGGRDSPDLDWTTYIIRSNISVPA